jgi:PKD repeat protein
VQKVAFLPVIGLSIALLVSGCQNDSQSPASRSEPPTQGAPEGGPLGPIDLIYVCGNKFLATNATNTPVQVTYRVVGTDEDGSLTLRETPGDDQSHSETELQTRERGVVELYLKDQRVARRRNGVLPCGPSPMSASVASLTATESGSWEAPFPWPVIALHLMLLPDGKVLSWGHTGQPQLWDPNSGNFTQVALGTELFCSGHTMLADGRILTAGGHITDDHGLPDINLFDPASQNWSSSTPMKRGRWYPNTTLLSTGEVVIIAGRDESSTVVGEPEVWSSGSVRVLSGASLVLPYYPRAFLAPNGKVFYAGEEQTTRYLDPSGTGSWKSAGNRLYGIRDYGAAVMYDVGKILYVGGGRTTNTAEIVDLNSAAPVWQWAGSMANARRHLNATVLPTGEVLVTGGSSGTGFNDVALAVHAAELWNPNPAPLGTWKVLASNVVNRTYHATSLLLPDGRVLHTGSGDGGGAPNENNAELFSPPYLFKGPRPTISGAPSSIDYGSTFTVTTPDASSIARVSLIHLGSVTHAFDMGQRFQRLSFQSLTGALTVTGPTSANVTPPGYYMLFVLTSDSVPSVAKIIRVGAPETTPPPNSAPSAGFSQTCSGLSCTFTDASTDADGSVTGWSWDFGDGQTSTTRSPTHNFGGDGTFTVSLTATDDDGATGTTSKVVTVTAVAANTAPTAQFSQVCNALSCTFTDASTDADGSVAGWSWDFGDGGTTTTRSPSHTFGAGGSYIVSLTATDDDGATGGTSKVITVTASVANVAPTAAFSQSCTALSCTFTDGSTDTDGSVTAWRWTFGDGGTSTIRSPSHTFTGTGTYTVTLTATDDHGATSTTSRAIAVTAPLVNAAPTAAFVVTCNQLTCRFTNRSTDLDGSVVAWKWSFGNGMTSTSVNPSRTYAAAGTYTVTLKVTDNAGAINLRSQGIPITSAITLTASGRVDATKQYVTVRWSGARGTAVDFYRFKQFLKQEPNDGLYTASRALPGLPRYTFYVCELGSTTLCSNDATLLF